MTPGGAISRDATEGQRRRPGFFFGAGFFLVAFFAAFFAGAFLTFLAAAFFAGFLDAAFFAGL